MPRPSCYGVASFGYETTTGTCAFALRAAPWAQRNYTHEDVDMTAGFVFAPARPMRHAASCFAAVAALALGSSLALAQAPAPAPTVPAPKATPRPVQQKAPAKQPQQPAQQPAQQAPQAPAGTDQADA